MFNIRVVSLYVILFYSCAIYFLGLAFGFNENSNIVFGFLSVASVGFVYSIARLCGVKHVSVFNLFLIGYSVFVFGRCFYIVLSYWFVDVTEQAENMYSLFWMANHTVDKKDGFFIFILTNFFILFFTAGFVLVGRSRYEAEACKKYCFPVSYKGLIVALSVFAIPYYLFEQIQVLQITMQQDYLAKFSEQAEGGRRLGIFRHLFFISVFSLFVFSKNYHKYIFFLMFVAVLSVLNGGRGGFVTLVLTLIYCYFRRKESLDLSVLKIAIILFLVFIVMSVLLSFSSRAEHITENTYDFFGFLYSQGVTLGVISYSVIADLDFKWHTLAQSIIPGMARMYAYFNPDVPGYMGSVTTFISYHANPDMFLSGNGLGTSIVSELYLLSFRFFPLFLFFCLLLGAMVSYVEKRSYERSSWFVFLLVMLPILIHSPRNGFNVLFISSFYVAFIIFSFCILSRLSIRLRDKNI